MDHPEFEVTITKTGKVSVQVRGVKGPKCLEYADLIKQIVGREERRELTSEYYAFEGDVTINKQIEQHRK